jgi:hypothetical protein
MSPLLNSNSASDIAAQRVDLVDVAKLCEYLLRFSLRTAAPLYLPRGETFPDDSCLRAQMLYRSPTATFIGFKQHQASELAESEPTLNPHLPENAKRLARRI